MLAYLVLTYLLAITVGLGSFGLYMAAFFFPEVYRKYDLAWSGAGIVYAITLWLSVDRMTPLLVIGQVALTALLGRFVWQNLELRRAIAPDAEKTAYPEAGDSLAAVIRYKLRALVRVMTQKFGSTNESSDR